MLLDDTFLNRSSYETADPYDFWSSKFGVFAKRVFLKNKLLGAPLVGIGLLLNIVKTINVRREYPIVRAQLALVHLNLYRNTGKKSHLISAKKHLEWLSDNKITFPNGAVGWGVGFTIVASKELVYDDRTAFSTVIPYVLEAFYGYYNISKDIEILELLERIRLYYTSVLDIEEDGNNMYSYYAYKNDRVVYNATSYTMYSYAIFWKLFNKEEDYQKCIKMKSWLHQNLPKEGIWFYEHNNSNSFIDVFHTAFVLKNLIKTNRMIGVEQERFIDQCYNYLKSNGFMPSKGLYKRFLKRKRINFIVFDLYDSAEMMTLAKLMGDRNHYYEIKNGVTNMFITREDIYSKIGVLNYKYSKNTLRWAVVPYIYALYGEN